MSKNERVRESDRGRDRERKKERVEGEEEELVTAYFIIV